MGGKGSGRHREAATDAVRARLVSLLMEGCSPREAAAKMGWNHNTVRGLLSSIYTEHNVKHAFGLLAKLRRR